MADESHPRSASDIAREEAVEHAIRESEERFKRLYENAPLPYQSLDEGGVIVDINPAWLEMLGYERGEVVGRPVTDFMPPDEETKFKERFPQFKVFGEVIDAEYTMLHSDGREVAVTVNGRVGTDADGGFVQTHSILQDVTARRRMEGALRESEERYRSIVESVPLGMHVYRLEGDDRLVFETHNPGADAILGVDNDQFVGKTIEEAFPQLAETEVPEAYRRVAREGGVWSTEQIAYEEGGIAGAFEVNAFQIGKRRVVAMFRDVTERIQDRQKLANYRDELEALVDMRTEELERVRSKAEAVTHVVGRAVEFRDPYTAGHQRRVAELVVALARELGMDDEEISDLRMAAEVHDIGKLSVPAEILTKPSKLSNFEFALIKSHPEIAKEILSSVDMGDRVVTVVLEHHERLDGSGYPGGLAGDGIVFGARLLAVADVVEAMSSHRPYRPGLGIDAALAEITENRGRLYEPDAVDACVKVFEAGFAFSDGPGVE